MKTRCNGCSRTDVDVLAYRCIWPDGRVSIDRHCMMCQTVWHRQLKSLGVRLAEVIDQDPAGTEDVRITLRLAL